MIPLPEGFGLVLDPSVRRGRDGTVLVGGYPGRLVTLTPEGRDELDAQLAGASGSEAARVLGRRLVDAGMAHPRPGRTGGHASPSVTVVVPVRDRAAELDRCLDAIGGDVPALVVDDGSVDPDAVADVCRAHGARLIACPTSGGPAAARNRGLDAVETELVAFVDSDCTVTAHWLERLRWLFEDPAVGAVAPRVRPSSTGARRRAIDRFGDGHSALDLGEREGEVGPDRLVRYAPTAALVVRRAALGDGFDEALLVGEDVDLVWRLVDAGWHVRYVPAVQVHHEEPTTWTGLLARRFRYGESAGPLARRHPDRLHPVELRPAATAIVVAALAGRIGTMTALAGGAAAAARARAGRTDLPWWLPLRWTASGAFWTAIGTGRALTMLASPALLAFACRSPRAARRVAALVLLPTVVEWWRRRPAMDPVRWAIACVADDVAYGAGVWSGSLRARTLRPVIPAVRATPRGPRSARD